MTSSQDGSAPGMTTSERITTYIEGLGDWRGQTLARLRELIREADPDMAED